MTRDINYVVTSGKERFIDSPALQCRGPNSLGVGKGHACRKKHRKKPQRSREFVSSSRIAACTVVPGGDRLSRDYADPLRRWDNIVAGSFQLAAKQPSSE